MTTTRAGNTDDTGFPGETAYGETGYGYGGCMGYASKVAECFQRDPQMAAAYCQYNIDMGGQADGPGCAQAFEAFYACLSNLDCASFEQGTGCDAQDMAIMQNCPSLGGP